MKEIKFRTWDKTKSKWADHNQQLSEVPVGASVIPPSILVVGDEDRYELNLFTGLKDKNGKEIYEGDIILYVDLNDREQHLVVEWSEDNGAFLIGWVRTDYATRSGEVVGNIYENPELLNA